MQRSLIDDPDMLHIQSFLEGDASAFNELVNRYERMIYNMAYRFTGNSADASDLTQDIFIQLYRKVNSFRGDSKFSTWFYRLALNRCKDWVSKTARRPHTLDIEDSELSDDGHSPSALYEQKEAQELVQKAIMKLPEDQRIVIIMYDIQGYSYDDLASILEIPLGTVKSRIARARLRLAELLSPHGNLQ